MIQRRMPDGLLADMLGRLGVALAAGVEARRAFASEAARVPARWRPAVESVAVGVAAGEPLATAFTRAGDAIKPAVRGLIAVGDRTGQDAETLSAIAATLRAGMAARRQLLAALAAPALRFAVALAVIGVMILVSGGMEDLEGRPLDLLGLGLTGVRGLTIYGTCLAVTVVAAVVALPAAVRSWADRGIVRRVVERLPLIGRASRDAEAAEWCRAASLAAAAGIDAGGLVAVSSQAAPGLALDADRVCDQLRDGSSLAEAVAADGHLPGEVLDAIAAGELSGTVAESLGRLVPGLEERARRGFAAAAAAVGFAAWVAVVGLVVLLVFRVMGVYVGIINQAGRPL
jgi:type II secretory pathway component PulF